MEPIATIPDQIDAIIADRYNNFQGKIFEPMAAYHAQLRVRLGDYSYLEFLKIQNLLNPKPKYQIPEEYFKTTN